MTKGFDATRETHAADEAEFQPSRRRLGVPRAESPTLTGPLPK